MGLLTAIGLANKNAILNVEFARELEVECRTAAQTALEAARERLRPIFDDVIGINSWRDTLSASDGALNAIGVGVMGGMPSATAIGSFMVPSLYVIGRHFAKKPLDMAADDTVSTTVTQA